MATRRTRRTIIDAQTADDTTPRSTRLAVWTLRAMLANGSWTGQGIYHSPDAALATAGFSPDEIEMWEPSRGKAILERRLRELEAAPPADDSTLAENIARLGDNLGLTELEQTLLHLGILCEIESGLGDSFSRATAMTPTLLARTVGRVIGHDPLEIRAALRAEASLPSMGLLRPTGLGNGFGSVFAVLDGFAELMTLEHSSADALLRPFFYAARPSALNLADFAHIGEEVDRLLRFLRSAMAAGETGVNVLLHGPPGTGKTELARVVAAELGLTLQVISAQEDEQTSLHTYGDRLSRHAMCQRVLQQRTGAALILFDEMEDVLPAPSFLELFGMSRRGSRDKGRIHHVLEHGRVPTVWISNRVDHVDSALLRRFTMTLAMDLPPRETRRRIVAHYLEGLPTSEAFIARIADATQLTPADLERAARVARHIGPANAVEAEAILLDELAVGLALRDQILDRRRVTGAVGPWELELLNADCDLEALLKGLGRRPRAGIGLYGPPGTGKTAFAHHVGARLGLEVIERKGSDLLGMYVGQNEQQVAAAFAEARRRRAILVLDEADTFLRDRREARASWEVSLVNELLVQIEQFDGLFFCASNRVETFDEAVFRRLALKIRFDPLKHEQRLRLFDALVHHLGVPPDPGARLQLEPLTALTPGDFAAVRQRLEILGCADAHTVAAALREECRYKSTEPVMAGFGRANNGWAIA